MDNTLKAVSYIEQM